MANDRQLIVRVVGDTKGLERGLKRSETQLQRFARQANTVGGAAGVGGGFFGGFGRGGAIAAGAGATVLGLKSVIGAAAESQQILGQTRVALEDSGLSWERYGAKVEAAAGKLSGLGFDDEEVLKSIATFSRATGDVDKAINSTALSADIARARYIDLASASNIVLKASLGQAGALRRIGIDAKAGATSVELLTLLQQKYGGAAASAANDATTANERLSVSLGNVQEQIGSGVLPVVTTLATELATSADNATSLVQALQKVKLPGGGGIPFGNLLKAGIFASPGLQVIAIENELRKRFGGANARSAASDSGKAFGDAFGLAALEAAGKAANSGPVPFGQPGFKPGNAPAVPLGPSAGMRNQWFDAGIARQLDRVQDIKTIDGQVAALRTIAAGIQKRIDATKDVTRKLNLEDQLVAVQRQTRGLVEQQASDQATNAAQRKADRQERDRQQAERIRQAQEAAAAAKQARQFKALGFDADGSEIVPGTANLKKQLASLTGRISDSNLNLPAKLKTQLAAAQKVLRGGYGDLTKESRTRIQELFATIRGEFEKGTKDGPLTSTTALSTERILAGLGLSAADERQIRARLSHFNSAGVGLQGSGAGSQAVQVNSTVVVDLDGKTVAKNTTKHQSRSRNVNTSQRNGPSAGRRPF
jgi:hypothetical protein